MLFSSESCELLRRHHGAGGGTDARPLPISANSINRKQSKQSGRFTYFGLLLCLLPLCCAARTPRTPHAALALLPLVHRTPHAHSPGPACGRLDERPCTRARVPPARGACTRAGQPRTQVRLRAGNNQPTTQVRPPGRKDAACPHEHKAGDADRWGTAERAAAPATGCLPSSSHARMAHTAATRPSSQGPASALRFIAPRAPEPEGRPRGGHAYPELNRRTKRSLIAGIGDCGQ